MDGDGVVASADCDDDDPLAHPGAAEVCDGVDNDCDGEIDNAGETVFSRDSDGDSYGGGADPVTGCSAPEGYGAGAADCDDADASVHPDAFDLIADDIDSDCDGEDYVTTVAGTGHYTGDSIPSTEAGTFLPSGMVTDTEGNLYIADQRNFRIRRIDTNGVITTFAGSGVQGIDGDGGPATEASMMPYGLAFDDVGNLYYSEISNTPRIRKIDPSGIITPFAGTGEEGFAGDGGPALDAQFDRPSGLAWSAEGLLIADKLNYRIRRVNLDGSITTVVGTGKSGGWSEGTKATSANIGAPYFLWVDSFDGTLYFSCSQGRVGRVDSEGEVYTVAGGGSSGDGVPATESSLTDPNGIVRSASGELFISDASACRVRRVDTEGTIWTVAGTGVCATSGDGGEAILAQLMNPTGITLDSDGDVIVSEYYGERVRRVDSDGFISSLAGFQTDGYSGDGGPANEARLTYPLDVTVGPDGLIYVADSTNNRVRRITEDGIIETVAGTGEGGCTGDDGPASEATIYGPGSLAFDAAGTLYLSDGGCDIIRAIDQDGIITTVAGTGTAGYSGDGGPALEAEFNNPGSLRFDSDGNLYILDYYNYRVRRMTPDGMVTTVAGNGTKGFDGDGGPATQAALGEMAAVFPDSQGGVYIAVSLRIRYVNPQGVIATVAGGGSTTLEDGVVATDAELNGTRGITMDVEGSLLFLDGYRLVKLDLDNRLSVLLGGDYYGDGQAEGPMSIMNLSVPKLMTIDKRGNLYIADSDNNRILKVDP